MTGVELLAGAMLEAAVGAGVKRAKTFVFGDAAINDLIKVGEEALDAALNLALAPYSDQVEKDDRTHLRSVLDRAIGLIAEPEALFPITSDPELRRQRLLKLVEQAHESQELDWDTFQIVIDGTTIRLDETQILRDFLRDLPTRVSARARAHGSALHEFSTEGHLVETLRLLMQLQSDVTLVLTQISALDWAQAGPRAIRLQRGFLDRRRLIEDYRTPYVESSATDAWAAVRARRDWPAEVLSELKRLRSEVYHYVGEASAPPIPLMGFHGAASASATLAALRALPLDPVEAALLTESQKRRQERKPEPRHEGHQDPGDDRRIGRTLVRVRWLKQQAKRPTFEVTLGLVGAFGSGRSALLTHIGEQLTAAEEFAVFLDLRGAADVESALLAQTARLFGGPFAAIEDLEKFLTSGQRVLHILIDDFDVACDRHPHLGSELTGLIDHATAARRLVFVTAFEEANTDRVLPGNDPYFWSRYGRTTGKPQAQFDTGLWDLERSNNEDLLGLRILAALNPSEAHDIDQIVTDPGAFATEAAGIVNPLAAWLRTETYDNSDPAASPLTDVNQSEFVGAYWRRLKTRRLAGPRPADTIDLCVTELARAFSDPALAQLVLDDLVAPRAIGGTGLSLDDLSLLMAAGLLLRHDGDVEVGQSALVEPRFAPLWGYRIARLLVFDANKDHGQATFQKRLSGWQYRARAGDALSEAVCQFTLTLLGASDDDSITKVWREWAGGNQTPQAPLLLASVGARPDLQRSVIDRLQERRYNPRTKRELFLLMRFVARCQLADWAGDQRLVMVQRSYGRVAEYGLPSYLHMVLSRVLGTPALVNEGNYVRTLQSLVGVDAADSAEVAAELAVKCGRRIFGDDLETWLGYLLQLCRRVAPAPRNLEVPPSPSRRDSRKSQRQQTKSHADRDPDAFVLALLKQVATEIVSFEPFGSYRVAAALGWCSASDHKVAKITANAMRDELNTAMGATFHRQGVDTTFANNYVELVADLVQGHIPGADPDLQREWAFFLIRNSAVTYGRTDVEVDQRFHGLLTVLAGDRDLTRRLRKWAEPLYRANGIRT